MKKASWITALSMIAVGLVLLIVAAVGGGATSFYWMGGAVHTAGEGASFSDTLVLPDTVNRLDVDLSTFKVEIVEGETFSYTIHSVYGRDQLEISTENQTLSIHKKWNAFPMMLRFGWMDTNQLVITVPKGTVLRSADIKVSMGETVITGLTAESISVENTMGSVKGTLHGKNLTVKTTMGEVNLSGNIAAMELKSVMGSCKVITSQPQEKYTAQTSAVMGDVNINDHAGVQGMGSSSLPLRCETVMGSITVYTLEKAGGMF